MLVMQSLLTMQPSAIDLRLVLWYMYVRSLVIVSASIPDSLAHSFEGELNNYSVIAPDITLHHCPHSIYYYVHVLCFR